MTTDFMTVKAGDVLPEFRLSLDADEVRHYLDATGEDRENWHDVIPPLALGALVLAKLTEEMPLPEGVVHSNQEFHFIEPVPVGERLIGLAAVERRGERRGTMITTMGIEVRYHDDRIALRARTTVVSPGVDTDANLDS